MEKEKNITQVDMKMPLAAVRAIVDGATTELAEFIRFDDTQRPQDVPLGQWAAQKLIDGDPVRVYDTEMTDKYWDVTLDMLRSGVLKYLEAGLWFLLDGDTLDAEALSPEDSIPIFALGVFGTPACMKEGNDDRI